MKAFLKLLTDLFARARGVGNKMSPKKHPIANSNLGVDNLGKNSS